MDRPEELHAPASSGQPAEAPPAQLPFFLFIYGTLTNPSVFRAVLGKRMVMDPAAADGVNAVLAREAVLPGYKRVNPDNTYVYAIPDDQAAIRGYVVGPLEPAAMEALERYEGRNYKKVQIEVRTANYIVLAYAFVADEEQMSHTFGYQFRDHLKQEVLLREKIDKVLLEIQESGGRANDPMDRRALAELHGSTIRDLVRQHFESAGISNFYIRQSLRNERLRDYQRLSGQGISRETCQAYLSLVIRQVLFNQIEERLHEEFRFDLDRMHVSDRFYERTISALATLRMLNEHRSPLDVLVGDALTDLRFDRDHLIDFVRWAVTAADAIYDSAEAQRHLQEIHSHMGHGFIPMGAEVEFSNIGHAVIGHSGAVDKVYEGFQYFSDFALDILMWKLGGHVDDHREKISDKPKRGFLEFAFGNLSIAANLSKPITDDPWLLNQMIQQTVRFYPVRPHSLHISLQLPHNQSPDLNAALPLGILKCLLALLGDPKRDTRGRVQLMRMVGDEIVSKKPVPHMLFSSISRRYSEWHEDEMAGGGDLHAPLVQQFKFMRLSPAIDYEPITMALKGIQISLRPGNFLTPSQYKNVPALRELFDQLMAWSQAATALGESEMADFIGAAREGLMHERHDKPAHEVSYIDKCLGQLREGLARFNAVIAG